MRLDEDLTPQVLDERLLEEFTPEHSVVLLEYLEQDTAFHLTIFSRLDLARKQYYEHLLGGFLVKQFIWKMKVISHEV